MAPSNPFFVHNDHLSRYHIYLICSRNILARYTTDAIGVNYSNTALAAQTTNSDSEGCTNPNCKAKTRSTHTTADCYWPGGGKEGQFPPDFGMRSRAPSVATSTSEQTGHFALSARVWNTPGNSGILISTPTHYDPTKATSCTTRQPNTINLPTAAKASPSTSLINTKHFALLKQVRKTSGHSCIVPINTMTNHAPSTLLVSPSQSYNRGRMPTARSDSLPQFTKRKPTAYRTPPSLTPHTDSGSVPLANHFTALDFDNLNAINDGHHIKCELDITDIFVAPRQSTFLRTSASVGEQPLTPLTAITEPEPITLPTHKTRFTGTTLLGNTTTATNPTIINHHIIRLGHHNTNSNQLNDDQPLAATPGIIPDKFPVDNQVINNNPYTVDHHHDIDHHHNQVIDTKPGTVNITAIITVKLLQAELAELRRRSTEVEQHETIGRVDGQDWATDLKLPQTNSKSTINWSPTSYDDYIIHHDVTDTNLKPLHLIPKSYQHSNYHYTTPTASDSEPTDNNLNDKFVDNNNPTPSEVQGTKDVGEILAVWRIPREKGDLGINNNFVDELYNLPHPVLTGSLIILRNTKPARDKSNSQHIQLQTFYFKFNMSIMASTTTGTIFKLFKLTTMIYSYSVSTTRNLLYHTIRVVRVTIIDLPKNLSINSTSLAAGTGTDNLKPSYSSPMTIIETP